MTCRCGGSTCAPRRWTRSAGTSSATSPPSWTPPRGSGSSSGWRVGEAWREKPEDAETAKAALLELVSEQAERLETLLAAHLERESAADPDALGFQDTQEGERLRRYQMACNRTLLRILETLRKRHREADQAKEGGKRGRKTSGSASGVESPTEADLLRETFGPVIAQGQEPLVQPAEAVPTDGLVGRGSPDPAPARPQVSRSGKTQRTKPPPLPFERESPTSTPTESLPPVYTDH